MVGNSLSEDIVAVKIDGTGDEGVEEGNKVLQIS